MQQSDARPPSSGRPSLLSPEQASEAQGDRILSGLDGKPAAPVAHDSPAKGATRWIAGGAVLAALVIGAGVWLVEEGKKEIMMANAAPAPGAAPAAQSAKAVAVPEEVSTAAILQDTSAGTDLAAKVVDTKPAPDELVKLFEPPAPVKAAPKPRPVKVAEAPKKKPVVKAKTAAAPDSDVELLAALVAHSKVQQARDASNAAKFKKCKARSSPGDAEQCKARLCATTAKNDAACKTPNLAKADAEA